jgi:hypothetical protein
MALPSILATGTSARETGENVVARAGVVGNALSSLSILLLSSISPLSGRVPDGPMADAADALNHDASGDGSMQPQTCSASAHCLPPEVCVRLPGSNTGKCGPPCARPIVNAVQWMPARPASSVLEPAPARPRRAVRRGWLARQAWDVRAARSREPNARPGKRVSRASVARARPSRIAIM